MSLLLQLGVCTLWGEGAHSSSLKDSLFLSRLRCVDGVRVWLLMPSGLLVWQIPYREMRSGAESQYPPWESLALYCVVWLSVGLVATRSWSVPSLTGRWVVLGRDWLGWARALLSDGPLDCTHLSVLRAWCVGAHGEFQMAVLLVGCCLFSCLGASLLQ